MTDKVVPFPKPEREPESPRELGKRLAQYVTLPDGTVKRYGELNFAEHTAHVAAMGAEFRFAEARLDEVYAAIDRLAAAGDPEAEAFLADPATIAERVARHRWP